jgi:hypothetical protein
MRISYALHIAFQHIRHLQPLPVALLILFLARHPIHRRSDRTHARQPKPRAETCAEFRRLTKQIDVGGNERTSGAKVHNRRNRERALVSTTGVHRHPDDRHGHGEVAAPRDEEHAHIPHLRAGWVRDHDAKTRCEDGPAKHVEVVASLPPLARVGEYEREDGAHDVDGDGVDLGLGCGVAQTFEDGGLEVCEGVRVFEDAEVHGDAGDALVSRSVCGVGTWGLPGPDLPVTEDIEGFLERD